MKIYPILTIVLLFFILPILAQEQELRHVDSDLLPNTFVNHSGTFAFDYPAEWKADDAGNEYKTYRNYLTNPNDLQAGNYVVYIRVLDESEAQGDMLATVENEAHYLDGSVTVEAILLADHYAVMLKGVSPLWETPLAEVMILVQANDAVRVKVTGFGVPDELDAVLDYVVDIAARVRSIDPEVLAIDTHTLTETYTGHGMRFRYPEGYFVQETDELVIVESADFSQARIYDGVTYTPFDLPGLLEMGIEGQHRLAFHLRTRAELAALAEHDDYSGDLDYFVLLETGKVPQEKGIYHSEWQGRRLLWGEYRGWYAHQIYFPDSFQLIYEMTDANYLFIEAHSYGFYAAYPVRLLMLNMLSTLEIEDNPDQAYRLSTDLICRDDGGSF